MEIMTNAQNVLNYINTAVQGDGLAFNENGVASLAIDNDIVCLFCLIEADQELVVTLYLGRVDSSDSELLYEILCGNYMGAYTGGGTLGIDNEEGLLALHQHFPLPIDEPAWIEEPLSALIGAARYWRDKLNFSQPGTQLSAENTQPSGMIRV